MIERPRTSSLLLTLLLAGCGGQTVSVGDDEVGEDGAAPEGEFVEQLCARADAPTGPVALVAGPMLPESFARVGDQIYWADDWDHASSGDPPLHTLYRSELGGDGPWVAVADEQPGIHRVLADDEAVYWLTEGAPFGAGQLLRASLDDEVELLEDDLRAPRALSFGPADDPWLYYSTDAGPNPSDGVALLRIPRAGGEPELLAEGPGRVQDLAIDQTHLWWVSWSTPEVWRVDKQGGEPEQIAEFELGGSQVVVHEGVAWILAYTGFYRILPGQAPEFIDGLSGPHALAKDDEHTYLAKWNGFEDTELGWIDRYPLTLGDIDPSSGEFVTEKFAPHPQAVAVDELAIYWSAADSEYSDEGGIWMLCK